MQILLDDPVPMVKGDFFVVRSAEDTLGGGQVVDPNPRRRHRRFNTEVVEQLMMLDQGTGEDILLSVADQWGPCNLEALSQRSNLSREEVLDRIGGLAENQDVVVLGKLGTEADAAVYSGQGWNILKGKIFVALQTYHNQYPLRSGAPIQEIRSRLGLSQPVYLRVLARLTEEGFLVEESQALRLPGHQVELSPQLGQQAQGYISALEKEPYSPPTGQSAGPGVAGTAHQSGQGGAGQRVGGVCCLGLPGDDRPDNRPPPGAGDYHRGRRPHHVRLQPQVHSSPAGIPGPATHHPPRWGMTGCCGSASWALSK